MISNKLTFLDLYLIVSCFNKVLFGDHNSKVTNQRPRIDKVSFYGLDINNIRNAKEKEIKDYVMVIDLYKGSKKSLVFSKDMCAIFDSRESTQQIIQVDKSSDKYGYREFKNLIKDLTTKCKSCEAKNITKTLRALISGCRISSISMYGNERIIVFKLIKFIAKADKGNKNSSMDKVIKTKEFFLIFELFSKGNIIICDEDLKILFCLRSLRLREKVIRIGKNYNLDKQLLFNNLEGLAKNLMIDDIAMRIKQSEKKSLVSCLAIDLRLGSLFSEYIINCSNLNKNIEPCKVSDDELIRLSKNIKEGIANYAKIYPKLNRQSEWRKNSNDSNNSDKKEENKKVSKTKSFVDLCVVNNKVKILLVSYLKDLISTISEDNKEIERIKRLIEKQEERIQKLEEECSKKQKACDMIYEHYREINNVIALIKELKKKGYKIEEINKELTKINYVKCIKGKYIIFDFKNGQ